MMSCCMDKARVCASFLRLSMSCSRASSALKLAIFSRRRICSSWCFSSSVRFAFTTSICLFRFSLMASFSLTCLSKEVSFWLTVISFCLSLFSTSTTLRLRSNTSLSCSDLSCTNLSLASNCFSFLTVSALDSASFKMLAACALASSICFLVFFAKKTLPATTPTTSEVAASIIETIVWSIFSFF